jgi:hypothetical protein
MGEGQASEPRHEYEPTRPQERTGGKIRPNRTSWLWENRIIVALGIALAEGLFVALEEDFSRVTVIIIAIPVILFYLLAGRTLESRIAREVSWVIAVSQALAVIVAILAILAKPLALVLAGIFGVIALYLILHDRPDESAPRAK